MLKKQKNVHQQIAKKKLARSLYQIDPLIFVKIVKNNKLFY